MEVYKGVSRERLDSLLEKISKVKVALIGDLCLDVYWKADMTKSELSRETPHFSLPVVEERMSPGAGGNAAANIAALKPESIKIFGVVGKDWRGDVLKRSLDQSGIDTQGVVVSGKMVTNAYCKPLRRGLSDVEYEDPRLDFANYKSLPQEDEAELLSRLDHCITDIGILCVSDQLVYGCITPVVREKILSYAKQGLKVIVDSRDRIGLFKEVILKPNEVEGLRAVYGKYDPSNASFENLAGTAKKLSELKKSKVCMTIGAKGCLYADSHRLVHIPSYEVKPPIDICGAGDTFLAAFSCALAAGAEPWEAASFANMAADVTIKKLGTTGTATHEEIKERHEEIFPSPGQC